MPNLHGLLPNLHGLARSFVHTKGLPMYATNPSIIDERRRLFLVRLTPLTIGCSALPVAKVLSADYALNSWSVLAQLDAGGRFGLILAIGVLEHVDHFERTVSAMVHTLKSGGWIVESSPFTEANGTRHDKYGVRAGVGGDDTRLHVGTRGVTMAQAMGPRMVRESTLHGYAHAQAGYRFWRKL